MSIHITDRSEEIITIEISGMITSEELASTQSEILSQLQDWGSGALLVVIDHFEGFAAGDWGDLTFQIEGDPLIKKMAFVGDPKWETDVTTFTGKGLRPFPITFFNTSLRPTARDWLKA